MRNGDRVRLRGVLLDRALYEQLPPPDRKIEVEKFLDALLTTLDSDVNGPDAWETRCISNAINALRNHMYTAALVYAVHALVTCNPGYQATNWHQRITSRPTGTADSTSPP